MDDHNNLLVRIAQSVERCFHLHPTLDIADRFWSWYSNDRRPFGTQWDDLPSDPGDLDQVTRDHWPDFYHALSTAVVAGCLPDVRREIANLTWTLTHRDLGRVPAVQGIEDDDPRQRWVYQDEVVAKCSDGFTRVLNHDIDVDIADAEPRARARSLSAAMGSLLQAMIAHQKGHVGDLADYGVPPITEALSDVQRLDAIAAREDERPVANMTDSDARMLGLRDAKDAATTATRGWVKQEIEEALQQMDPNW